jgi:hypothetical protein
MRQPFLSVLAAFAALISATSTVAQTTAPASSSEWAYSGKVGLHTQYLGGYYGMAVTANPVFQASLTASHKSGWFAGGWVDVPTGEQWNKGFGTELDWYLGHSANVLNGRANLTLSTTIFDMEQTWNFRGDIQEVAAEITSTRGHVRPFAYLGIALAYNRDVLEGGTAWNLGAYSDVKVGRQPVAIKAYLLGHDGVFGFAPQPVSALRVNASVTQSVARGKSLSYGLAIQRRIGPKIGSITSSLAVGSVTYKF